MVDASVGHAGAHGHRLHRLKHLFDGHNKDKKANSITSHLLSKLGEDVPADKEESLRHKTLKILESYKFEILISVLVMLELIVVIIEVAINNTVPCEEIEELCVETNRHSNSCATGSEAQCYGEGLDIFCKHHAKRSCHTAEIVGHISMAFLIFFLVELTLKLILSPKRFMMHFGHVLDIVVVVISLVLEILHKELHNAGEFVIVLRSWRIIRIAHGFYEQYHTVAKQEHIMKESEDALGVALHFLDDNGLHNDFHNFCTGRLAQEQVQTAI